MADRLPLISSLIFRYFSTTSFFILFIMTEPCSTSLVWSLVWCLQEIFSLKLQSQQYIYLAVSSLNFCLA